MKRVLIVLVANCLLACGGGSGDSNRLIVVPEVRNDVPGGIWTGTDSDDNSIVAFADDDGAFYIVSGDFAESSGLLTISNRQTVSGIMFLAQKVGTNFPGLDPLTDCSLSGTLIEHESLTLDVKCRLEASQQVLTTLTLKLDARYERGSSLATTAGVFDYEFANALNIATDGAIFGQDSTSGCISNGVISLINTLYNLYRIELSFSNCSGQDGILNGEFFAGLAVLDGTVDPEQLIIALSGDVDGTNVSFVSYASRL